MQLRLELLPPKRNAALEKKLVSLLKQVIDCLDTNGDYAPLIAEFNQTLGTSFDISDIDGADRGEGLKEFVTRILVPERLAVGDVTENELLELIHRIMQFEKYSERDREYWHNLVATYLRCPVLEEFLRSPSSAEALQPAEVLQRARAWKPIML